MPTALKKAIYALVALTVLAACTPRFSQSTSLLPTVRLPAMNTDPTPPPCPLCDSDGGMPK